MPLSAAHQQKLRYLGLLAAIGAAAFLLTIYFFCPRFVLWQGLHLSYPDAHRNPEVNRALDVLKQLQDPFVEITDQSNEVIRWRLLFPLIGHYLHSPVRLYMAIPHIGCLIALAYVAHLILREGQGLARAFFAATVMATCSWFFVATGWLTYADSWYIFGLLICSFHPSLIAVAAACLLIPLIDERFVLTLPLAMIVRVIYFDRAQNEQRKNLIVENAVIAGFTVPYVLLRLIMYAMSDSTSQHYVSFHWEELSHVAFFRFVEGFWSGLRAAWILVAALIWLVYRRKEWITFGLMCGALLVTLVIALLVAADIGRSMSAFVPTALLGLILVIRQRPDLIQRGLPALMFVNLLLPASNVITLFKEPLFSLYTEIDRYQNPPPFLDPRVFVSNSEMYIQQGNWTDADQVLAWALEIDPTNRSSLFNRAMVNLRINDLPKATEFAERALAVDPMNPDMMYLRGVVFCQAGNLNEGRRLIEASLNHSAPDWSRRAAASSLLDQINSAQQQQQRQPNSPGAQPSVDPSGAFKL